MNSLIHLYSRGAEAALTLQSPLLLAVRLYRGWQFAQAGWGKMHDIAKITGFFASLNIPFPSVNAHFVAGLEFFRGISLTLGLGSRLIALLLSVNMPVAYWTADRDALVSIFSNPSKFYAAHPYTFLFASLLVLIFGAGFFSVDTLLARRFTPEKA